MSDSGSDTDIGLRIAMCLRARGNLLRQLQVGNTSNDIPSQSSCSYTTDPSVRITCPRTPIPHVGSFLKQSPFWVLFYKGALLYWGSKTGP